MVFNFLYIPNLGEKLHLIWCRCGDTLQEVILSLEIVFKSIWHELRMEFRELWSNTLLINRHGRFRARLKTGVRLNEPDGTTFFGRAAKDTLTIQHSINNLF